MKKERPSGGNGSLNAFLGTGTTFKGHLTFEGTVRVDGTVEGEITTKDTLIVGEGSTVRATIHAGYVVLSGTVHGDIVAAKKVELSAGARLFGNISTPTLSMAEGVIFEGACTMGQKKQKDSASPAPPPSLPKKVPA